MGLAQNMTAWNHKTYKEVKSKLHEQQSKQASKVTCQDIMRHAKVKIPLLNCLIAGQALRLGGSTAYLSNHGGQIISARNSSITDLLPITVLLHSLHPVAAPLRSADISTDIY